MAGNSGVNHLARAIKSSIARQMDKPDTLELGTIQDDYSLLLDRFPHPIPLKDYLVCRTLTLPQDRMTATPGPATASDGNAYPIEGHHGHGPNGGHSQYVGDGVHSHPKLGDPTNEHFHTVLTPSQLRPLWPGDRVLVAWVNSGNDPVVVDVVVPGEKIKKKGENMWGGPIPD